YIVIEEKDKSQMLGLVHDKDYVFHLKKAPKEWSGLKSHELVLLAALFSNGLLTDVMLSSLQNQFYKNLPGIRDSIFDALMERGYFHLRPDYMRSTLVGGGIVLGVLFFFLGNAIAQKMGMAPAPFLGRGVLSGGIIAGCGCFMSTRTLTGIKALSAVLGFEDFLTHVEAGPIDRIGQTPET